MKLLLRLEATVVGAFDDFNEFDYALRAEKEPGRSPIASQLFYERLQRRLSL